MCNIKLIVIWLVGSQAMKSRRKTGSTNVCSVVRLCCSLLISIITTNLMLCCECICDGVDPMCQCIVQLFWNWSTVNWINEWLCHHILAHPWQQHWGSEGGGQCVGMAPQQHDEVTTPPIGGTTPHDGGRSLPWAIQSLSQRIPTDWTVSFSHVFTWWCLARASKIALNLDQWKPNWWTWGCGTVKAELPAWLPHEVDHD